MVDIPGCYSLMAHSTEEEVARDFICFENPDAVIVVCDATCLERNLNLVLQILEANRRAVVCVNLMDEAKKKSISIRFDVLEERLGVPVIGTAARSGKGLEQIYEGLKHVLELNKRLESARYMEVVEGEYAETEAVDVEMEAVVEAEVEDVEVEAVAEAEDVEMEAVVEAEVEDVEVEAEAEAEAEETENAEAKMKIEEAGSKEAEEAEEAEAAETVKEAEAETKNIAARDIEARNMEAAAENVNDIENEVRKTAEKAADRRFDENPAPRILIRYPEYIEAAIARLTPVVRKTAGEGVNIRWLCARLLDSNENLMEAVRKGLASLGKK